MRLDKTVIIPNYTEIDVEINTDEILEDMDMDSIVDYAVENYGNKLVLRYMQDSHDFSESDIEEAVGRQFDAINIDGIIKAVNEGELDSQEILINIPKEDIEEYVKGLDMYIKKQATWDDVLAYIKDTEPAMKVAMIKTILKDD